MLAKANFFLPRKHYTYLQRKIIRSEYIETKNHFLLNDLEFARDQEIQKDWDLIHIWLRSTSFLTNLISISHLKLRKTKPDALAREISLKQE